MSANVTHNVYLIRPEVCAALGENVFKLGRTINLRTRMNNYDMGGHVIATAMVRSCHAAEKELIRVFETLFQKSDRGNEYFVGDPDTMQSTFLSTIMPHLSTAQHPRCTLQGVRATVIPTQARAVRVPRYDIAALTAELDAVRVQPTSRLLREADEAKYDSQAHDEFFHCTRARVIATLIGAELPRSEVKEIIMTDETNGAVWLRESRGAWIVINSENTLESYIRKYAQLRYADTCVFCNGVGCRHCKDEIDEYVTRAARETRRHHTRPNVSFTAGGSLVTVDDRIATITPSNIRWLTADDHVVGGKCAPLVCVAPQDIHDIRMRIASWAADRLVVRRAICRMFGNEMGTLHIHDCIETSTPDGSSFGQVMRQLADMLQISGVCTDPDKKVMRKPSVVVWSGSSANDAPVPTSSMLKFTYRKNAPADMSAYLRTNILGLIKWAYCKPRLAIEI